MTDRADPVEVAARALRERGQRVTAPRRAVVEVLSTLRGHPGAEEISAAVARDHPHVHRATVYRTLDTLTELGVVTHVHSSHGTTAYHLADPDEPHQHLHARCRVCHRVIDLPAGLLDGTVAQVQALTGFTVEPGHVALSGLCERCR